MTLLIGIVITALILGALFLPLPSSDHWQRILRRLAMAAVTLVIIAYLTLFGLMMAERGREGLPAEPLSAAGETLQRTLTYLTDHPTVYYWDSYEVPALTLVARTFGRSAGLLLISLGAAALLGVPLGIAVALSRRKGGASLLMLISIFGISTPSFLLAMLFWVINIQIHRRLAIPVLPPTGFGWDLHLVMPVIVLAARPLAQIAQVTYVSLSEVLAEDYIRTAHAKGLRRWVVLNRHALRNVLIPILTTIGTSLRFSLASLPVVEYFFLWSGVGLMLLEAIEQNMTSLVTDLIVSLGFLFLLINLVLELVYPLLDPRLRAGGNGKSAYQERQSWRAQWEEFLDSVVDLIRGWWLGARHTWRRITGRTPSDTSSDTTSPAPPAPDGQDHARIRHQWLMRHVLGNPALITGTILVIGLLIMAIFGEGLIAANPYEIHGVMTIEDEIAAPPFPPSSVFPWGTDHLGRDLRALVLAGARQTMALAFFGMLARVVLGTVLGMLAGWWQDSWLDRLVTGAVGVWAAFPYTLFTMLVIQALGIQQGMKVFIIALCVVGWGEVAQFVRGQVVRIQPRLFIEAARAVGAHPYQILARHVLPNLLSALLVLATLEMGGVLMLLAELGFLNIFLGGGFRVQIAEGAGMRPIIAYVSDVPEWGALLANIRDWWRSYPWMAWYPGVAFFLAIIAFNVLGEGLRRFLTESRINLNRLFNRTTLLAGLVAVAGLWWMLRSTAPISVYRSQAARFNTQHALSHIEQLASPAFEGRESGTAGAAQAADYIAAQMKEIGLAPGGTDGDYRLAMKRGPYRLNETPRLEIITEDDGTVIEALTYREDFLALKGPSVFYDACEGRVMGLALGPHPERPEDEAPASDADAVKLILPGSRLGRGDPYGLRNLDLYDKIFLVREEDVGYVNMDAAVGLLIIGSTPHRLERKDLYGYMYTEEKPAMYITPEVADRLLRTAGSSLAAFNRQGADLGPGETAMTDPGAMLRMHIPVTGTVYNYADLSEMEFSELDTLLGYIPGSGADEMLAPGEPMSNQAIIVSAYYDGVGMGLEGELYPGANDNASGVATMLEIARVLQAADYEPKRTVVFIAWPEGERYQGLSLTDAMNATIYMRNLTPEAVIELSGVGAGTGESIFLAEGTSFRLTQLFQEAAGRVGSSTTTRGRGPHYGIPQYLGFGGRSALSAYVHWDGADDTAHTLEDTIAAIDPEKLDQVGQTTLLAVTVLSRERDY